MFTALRRLTILFVMAEEYVLLDTVPSAMVSYTVGVQFLGAVIAGWYDLTFDPVSYFYLFLTNLFTSLYTVYISVVRKRTGLNIFAMMYYMNVSSMPFLLVLAWYTGDISTALAFPHYGDLVFLINFSLSVVLAFLLNLSTFYCTSLNTARTQTVVGQLKNFGAFLLGLILFDDYIYEPLNFLGLWIGFAGSVWYAFVQADEKEGSAAPAAGGSGRGAAATPSKPLGVLDTIKEEEDLEMASSIPAAGGQDDVRKRAR
jgi:solute carrier family 35 protein